MVRGCLDAVLPLPEAFHLRLQSLLSRRDLEPKDHFSPLGSLQKVVGILELGVMRAYATTRGREYTGHLYFAPTLVGDYRSIITGQPVVMPQQALTKCVVWTFPFASVVALEKEFPEIVHFRRVFAETMYLLKEQRELDITSLTATQRYRQLRAQVPDLDSLLPQYEIAAFLGITASQLSRIRATLM